MITENQIHYMKMSIRDFKESPRIKVNMDIANTDRKLTKLTWRLTQERRELYNSLQGAEDEGWQEYDSYTKLWKGTRKERGQGVKLWIGKLAFRTRWSPGGAQPLDRVPFAVGLLLLDRSTGQLDFIFNIDGYEHQAELQIIQDSKYNRVYTWQNPLSQIEGRRTRRLEL